MSGQGVGDRVQQARHAKGLTQMQLAGLTGLSESSVRGLEKGRQPLVKRITIDRLAEVLTVDVAWLLGQPYAVPSPEHDAGHGGIPALRSAIRRASLILSGHPGIPAVTPSPVLTEVRRRVTHASRLRQAADLPGVMSQLPDLLETINTSLLDADNLDEAHRLLIETGHIARMICNQLGHHDLAWSAVEIAALAAARLGDPLYQACSAWDRCGVLLHTGSVPEMISVAEAALGHLEPRLSAAAPTPEELSLWGALHLRCAIAAARRHDPAAWGYLAEAERTAERLGGDRNDFQTVFGPSNTQIHGVEIAVEFDLPDTALRRARPLDLSGLRSRERAVHHGITLARAHGQINEDANAVRVLTSAAAVSPAYVHNHPMARGLVLQVRQRSQPEAVEAGLGSLTQAMALPT